MKYLLSSGESGIPVLPQARNCWPGVPGQGGSPPPCVLGAAARGARGGTFLAAASLAFQNLRTVRTQRKGSGRAEKGCT